MTRQEAKERLAAARLPLLDEEDREGLIMEWTVFDDEETAMEKLPSDLRAALLAGEEIEDAALSKYDPLILLAIEQELNGVRNEYLQVQLAALGIKVDSVEGEPEMLESCPCCGYRTIEELHSFEICPVCYWIDDDTPAGEVSEDNEMTLAEARKNFAKYGITDESIQEFRLDHPEKVYYR